MKENVIIGKLIPAGTGMRRYRDTRLSTDENLLSRLHMEDEFEFDDGSLEDEDFDLPEDMEEIDDLDDAEDEIDDLDGVDELDELADAEAELEPEVVE